MGSVQFSKIRDGVFSVVREKGLQALSLEEVSALTGTAADEIIASSKDFDDLLNQIFLSVKQDFIDRVLAGYREDLSFKKGFELMWNNAVDFYIEHADAAIFMHQFMISPRMTPAMTKASEEQNLPIYDLLVRGQDLGLVKPYAAPLLVYYINGAVKEVVSRVKMGTININSPWRENAFIMSWEAVKA